MEIILLENVANLGKIGDMINVKSGFARNFLLPQKKAIIATPKNLNQFQHQKRIVSQKIEKNIKKAKSIAEKLEKESITIERKSQDDERLYGSVTTRDIEEILQSRGYDIHRKNILLEQPIKKPDVYTIPIKLYQDVLVNIKLWVVIK